MMMDQPGLTAGLINDVLSREADSRKVRHSLRDAAKFLAPDHELIGPTEEDLIAGAISGDMPVYPPNCLTRVPHGKHAGQDIRSLYNEASWQDLNTWIRTNRPRNLYRFTPPPMKASLEDPEWITLRDLIQAVASRLPMKDLANDEVRHLMTNSFTLGSKSYWDRVFPVLIEAQRVSEAAQILDSKLRQVVGLRWAMAAEADGILVSSNSVRNEGFKLLGKVGEWYTREIDRSTNDIEFYEKFGFFEIDRPAEFKEITQPPDAMPRLGQIGLNFTDVIPHVMAALPGFVNIGSTPDARDAHPSTKLRGVQIQRQEKIQEILSRMGITANMATRQQKAAIQKEIMSQPADVTFSSGHTWKSTKAFDKAWAAVKKAEKK